GHGKPLHRVLRRVLHWPSIKNLPATPESHPGVHLEVPRGAQRRWNPGGPGDCPCEDATTRSTPWEPRWTRGLSTTIRGMGKTQKKSSTAAGAETAEDTGTRAGPRSRTRSPGRPRAR